jgi:Trk K+ transport system NAD-binding subunit
MRTIIVGGGRIGRYVSKELEDFIIIERERIRAENLARELGEDHVMVGDGADTAVLKRAGARQAEALLAITDHDDTNLKVALAAKALGVPRIVARCNDPSFIEVMHYEGVDNVICPAETASRMIHSTLFHGVEEVTSIHVTKGSPLDEVRLGDAANLAGTRVLGVIRRKDFLKPDQGLLIKAGDEVLLCSLGGLTPQLKQLMAHETVGLLPFSEMVVALRDESQVEMVGDESLYLASHLGRIPVEVHYPAERLPERMQDLAQIWGVPVSLVTMTNGNQKDLSYLQYRGMREDTLVTVGPGEITERRMFKECELGRILGLETAHVMICRRKIPYDKILAVFDGSDRSMELADMALKIAIHTGSSLHVLDISEMEGPDLDMEHLRRLGQRRSVEVKELSIEGNPTLDLVALVTGGGYSLLVMRWTCQNVRRDILRKVVSDSSLSVLLVR